MMLTYEYDIPGYKVAGIKYDIILRSTRYQGTQQVRSARCILYSRLYWLRIIRTRVLYAIPYPLFRSVDQVLNRKHIKHAILGTVHRYYSSNIKEGVKRIRGELLPFVRRIESTVYN